MDDVVLKVLDKPKLTKPVLIEALPGIGLVGKLAGDHLMDELKAKKLAEIYSPYLPPQVVIADDGTIELVNMSLYYHKGGKRDVVFLCGGFQGITPDSQYHLSEKTVEYAKKLGVQRIYTLGGLGTGALTNTPKVYGAATTKALVKEHAKRGIIFRGGGAIFGASGLLIGLGAQAGVEGVCLMGETHGQLIDAKSAEAVLTVLTKILGIEVNMSELDKKAKQTEEQMAKISKMIAAHQKIEEQQSKFVNERPTYIR